MNKYSFLRGAMILTVAGILVKLFGAVNRILLSRLLGGEGIGLYQMAYPIYILALSFSAAGLPIAISIMVAEKMANKNLAGANRILYVVLTALFGVGLMASLSLVLVAHWLIATGIVRDERAYYALVALAPALSISIIMGGFRGYFQGFQTMTPTAVSQIFDQFFRVLAMVAFAVLLLPYGLTYAAAGAAFGAVPGSLMGLLSLLYCYRYHRKIWRAEEYPHREPTESVGHILYRLLVLAVPVSMASIMLPVVASIDLFIVPKRLEAAGYTVDQATTLFGYLTGMATSLVNLPTILTVALAASLVPAVSDAWARRDSRSVLIHTETAMRIANTITIPAFVGMAILATPISQMLYATPYAGSAIRIMAVGAVFLGIQQVTTGVLQGLGHTGIPLANMIVSALVKIVLSWHLTAMPQFGIEGAAWSTNADLGVAAVLNLYFVYRYSGYTMDMDHTKKLLLAAALMGGTVFGMYVLTLRGLHNNTLATVGAIGIGLLLYLLALLRFKVITAAEAAKIPKIGEKIGRLLKRFEK